MLGRWLFGNFDFSFLVYVCTPQDGKSVMTKIYNTLKRTRGKKELEEARENMKDDGLVRASLISS